MDANTLRSVQSNDTGLDNSVYFIGQDLHSNNVYVTVMVNQVREDGTSYGKVVASRRISLRKGQKEYIDFMSRFCEGKQHVAVVESTYNVYWMNDLFEERGWNLLIADPSTVSRDKTKAGSDDHQKGNQFSDRSLKASWRQESDIRTQKPPRLPLPSKRLWLPRLSRSFAA